jgi:endonuclease YncB( thermonuclease family)
MLVLPMIRWALLFLPLLLAASPLSADAPAIAGQATVIDGDTIEIHGQRIRLYAIDAPEAGQSCEASGADYPCGRLAAFALADRIGREAVTCRGVDTDRYQRIVAVCEAGGEDLAAFMVRSGWAMAERRYGLEYVGDEDIARERDAGIWRGAFIEPWVWRKRKAGPFQ